MGIRLELGSTLATCSGHLRTVDASDAGGITARVEEMDSEVRDRVDRLHLSGRVGRQRHPPILLAGERHLLTGGRELQLPRRGVFLHLLHVQCICRQESMVCNP